MSATQKVPAFVPFGAPGIQSNDVPHFKRPFDFLASGAILLTAAQADLPVYVALQLLRGLMADRFCSCWPTLAGFRPCLEAETVLLALRKVAAVHLDVLPPPLGLRPPPSARGKPKQACQQPVGPDPPWVQG